MTVKELKAKLDEFSKEFSDDYEVKLYDYHFEMEHDQEIGVEANPLGQGGENTCYIVFWRL